MFSKFILFLICNCFLAAYSYISYAVDVQILPNRNIACDVAAITAIENFVKENYDHSNFTLSRAEASQLKWLFRDDTSRYINCKDQDFSISQVSMSRVSMPNVCSSQVSKELPAKLLKVLSRLYCLHLLREGGQENYALFTAPQLKPKEKTILVMPNSILKYESFKELSKKIQKISGTDYEALRAATIIYSIEKTKSFTAGSKDDLAFKLFRLVFAENMNFRQMLFVNGGVGMFKNLREKIQYSKISKQDLEFWYYFWIINIAGFYGNLEYRGSLMLDENVYRASCTLKQHLDRMFDEPNYDPLFNYLLYRANIAGLDMYVHNFRKKMVLAHIASLLYINDKDRSKKLVFAFNSLDESKQESVLEEVSLLLSNYEEEAPIYVAAFLAQCYLHTNKNMSKTVKVALPIYARALRYFRGRKEQGELLPNARLNFYNLATKNEVATIFDNAKKHKDVNFVINEEGFVQLSLHE